MAIAGWIRDARRAGSHAAISAVEEILRRVSSRGWSIVQCRVEAGLQMGQESAA
jgi:hypothetical protein